MGLINLHTNLKDLRFGHDRPGGGSSNQPYITADPNKPQDFQNENTDFLLRGGILAPVNSALDVVRLGKYFTDIKSPSGLLFIIKQNLLSRVAVRTQASGRIVNAGVYTPLSTLSQAGVNAFGLHFNKQGLNPIPGSLGSLTTYSDVVGGQNSSSPILGALNSIFSLNPSNIINTLSGINQNRLTSLYEVKIKGNKLVYSENGIISTKIDPSDILSYSGGPGSNLGIGITRIKFADQRTGLNNPNYGKQPKIYLSGIANSLTQRPLETEIQKPTGVSVIYNKLVLDKIGNKIDDVTLLSLKSSLGFNNGYNKQYTGGNNLPQSVYSITNNNFGTVGDPTTFTQNELIENLSYRVEPGKLIDFRKKIRDRLKNNNNPQPNVLSESPDYQNFKIENRVGLGDYGNSIGKDLSSYVKGFDGSGSASSNSYDKVTVKPLYRSSSPSQEDTNDLVKFRIAAIDNDAPDQKVYIHFRAFLRAMDDGFSSDWSATRYTGRGEHFYTYEGFDRKYNLSFDVAAQSKIELIPIYKKLNYLSSQLMPDYSKFGYMRGPLIQLTIGGYFYEQPGFITSLTYGIPEETTWEIGITDSGDDIKKFDSSVKELPHLIKVTGFQFTPIHNFVPRKGKFDDLGKTPFIALSNGINTNY